MLLDFLRGLGILGHDVVDRLLTVEQRGCLFESLDRKHIKTGISQNPASTHPSFGFHHEEVEVHQLEGEPRAVYALEIDIVSLLR